MHTEISRYHATASKDVLARLALQRASIMHLVDLKRGGYSPCRTELRIDRLTDRPIAPPMQATLKELPTPSSRMTAGVTVTAIHRGDRVKVIMSGKFLPYKTY